MNEIPENLKSAMEKYVINIEQMNRNAIVVECRLAVDNARSKLEAVGKVLADAEFEYREQALELEKNIKFQVLELGASASHEGVEAKYRSGYTSETYPVKDVRKILLANPAILPEFNAISVVKDVAPSVSVSYKAPESE